jgi:hypothetical protein
VVQVPLAPPGETPCMDLENRPLTTMAGHSLAPSANAEQSRAVPGERQRPSPAGESLATMDDE